MEHNYDITLKPTKHLALFNQLAFPWKTPRVLKKKKKKQPTKICLVQILSLSTSYPKYYASMPKSGKKKTKTGMFSNGKVVENAFRLNIPSDPRMVDIHLFVCITLVIEKKKSLNFSASRQPLQHTHISYPFSIPQSTLATCLSSIYVKII